jgi:hypothetical protein
MIDPKLKKVLEEIIRAGQANQDHLSGEAREFAHKFNLLGNDVATLYELLGVEYKNESNEESEPDSYSKPKGMHELSDDTPEPLGTAASGDDDEASRDDHVHEHGALSSPSSAHDADDIDFTPAAGIAASNVQAAIEEDAGDLAAHLADTVDAHDASAISILDAAGDFTATDVEGALAELQADNEAGDVGLVAHLTDTSDAHDASAVSIVDTGGFFTGTEVEAALQELGAGGGGAASFKFPFFIS